MIPSVIHPFYHLKTPMKLYGVLICTIPGTTLTVSHKTSVVPAFGNLPPIKKGKHETNIYQAITSVTSATKKKNSCQEGVNRGSKELWGSSRTPLWEMALRPKHWDYGEVQESANWGMEGEKAQKSSNMCEEWDISWVKWRLEAIMAACDCNTACGQGWPHQLRVFLMAFLFLYHSCLPHFSSLWSLPTHIFVSGSASRGTQILKLYYQSLRWNFGKCSLSHKHLPQSMSEHLY